MAFGKYRKVRKYRKSGKSVKSIKRIVNKLIVRKSEKKFNIVGLPATFGSVGTAWIETDFTNLSQGSAQGNRIGDSINAYSIGFKGVFAGGQSNLATDDVRNTVRIILAWWDGRSSTPCATNAVALSSLIQSDETTGAGLIKILYDRTFYLQSPGRDSTGYMPALRYLKFYKKLNRKINYLTTTSTTSQKRLIMSVISDSAVVSHPGFISGYGLFKFTDQ